MTRAERAKRAAEARQSRPNDCHHPATAEMNYTSDQVEFMMAIDELKKRTGNQFPTLCETLKVLVGLGYSKR
jgi:hypothetical protein